MYTYTLIDNRCELDLTVEFDTFEELKEFAKNIGALDESQPNGWAEGVIVFASKE